MLTIQSIEEIEQGMLGSLRRAVEEQGSDLTPFEVLVPSIAWLLGDDQGEVTHSDIKSTIGGVMSMLMPSLGDQTKLAAKQVLSEFFDNRDNVDVEFSETSSATREPEGALYADWVTSLPYVDAETELTDGTVITVLRTKTETAVHAFDYDKANNTFTRRTLTGTLSEEVTGVAAVPAGSTVH